ncbi:MAG TPA: c-type cytochrome biogenesis protein CcsB [Planktothrix sp.]|jgi:cytochrome c-type biogenesis protein CcsB
MSDFQVVLTNTAGISSVASFWVFVASNGVKRWKELMLKSGSVVMAVGFASLTAAIIMRGFEAGRFPLANLYESLLWFAWATMGGYLLVSTMYGIRQLGWLAALTAATFFLYGSWLPSTQHDITPLVPALVSYWRQIHVPPLIVSYAMFFLAGLSGLLQLWHARRITSLFCSVGTIVLAGAAIALGTYTTVDTYYLQALFVGGSLGGTVAAWLNLKRIGKKPDEKQAETYDDVGYRCIAIGFPLLTIGIITGGLWANHAWGSYWSWDPKESMALVTWLSYAAYIHLRIHREVSAEKLSIVSVAGLLLTLLTYLGFNSLGFGGLHSYGRFK